MRITLLFVTLASVYFSPNTFAIVDMKSANYSETWTTMQLSGVGYDLRVSLTYNSRSLFNGKFGYGWCSDFETKIEVTSESNLRLTECGGGMEVKFMPKSYRPDQIDGTVKTIMAEVRKRRPDLKSDYLRDLEADMKANEFLREEFIHRMNIQTRVADGTIFFANGHEAENIVLKNGVYKRTLSDGTYQMFDAQGRMTHMYDRNGNFLKLTWDHTDLLNVADNSGRKLTFKYNPTTHRATEVLGPNGMVSKYVIKGEDLVEIIDAKKEKYAFAYDDVHNMTRAEYPDHTYKALTYNKDKDWVTSFRNTKGCIEKYDYQMSQDDPKNHFWSKVEKKCGAKVTNNSTYEFFHKPRPDGLGVYLYRVKSDNNGDITDIVYHEIFGKPLTVIHNGVKTEYTYYPNGYVRTKRETGRLLTYEYKNLCNKVSAVNTEYFQAPESRTAGARGRRNVSSEKQLRVAKTIRTKFIYDQKKCNLEEAENSEGQHVKLQYDPHGRISEIEDQAKKLVKIKYEDHFGKPATVTRPGLGTIFVSYKPDGEIAKVESKEGPNVAIQVASIFNNLLDIIAPATTEMPL
jgi:YD repeat-containing protein